MSQRQAGQAHHSGGGLSSGVRLDVQGLRAVAVLAVVSNHLWHWPSGGFVGVDVFFVVSGFLITGLLLREHDRTRRISFVDFYRRRARRILPAAAFVIVATVAATHVISSSARSGVVLRDGVWALLFSANWRFASVGTDYFRADASISPLQHYWSLGIEEQFYVVWPIVIVLCLAWAGRKILLTVLGVLVAASFVYSIWHTGQAPTWAYFSTLDRAWELGVGALLAVVASRLHWSLPTWARLTLAWAGLTAIAVAVALVPESPGFPAPWAALPVLGTTAVIAAGTYATSSTGLWPLTSVPAQYVGNISYSLYLWHFPVIILAAAFLPERGRVYYVACIVLMGALSSLSYHLIERPVLRSGWLERNKHRPRVGFWTRGEQLVGVSAVTVLALAVSSAAIVRSADVTVDPPFPQSYESAMGSGPKTPEDFRTRDLLTALNRSEFPDLEPSLDELGIENWAEQLRDAYCLDVLPEEAGDCSFGPEGGRRAALIGDSYAMAWMPGVATALTAAGYRVQQLTRGECPVWDVPVSGGSQADFAECETYRDWVLDHVGEGPYDLVVASTAVSTVARLQSGNEGSEAAAEITAGLARSLKRLQAPRRSIVVLSAPPKTPDLRDCVTNVGRPGDCTAEITEDWELVTEAEAAAAAQVLGARYVDTSSLFCAFDHCPGFIGQVPIRVDGSHLSIAASENLAPLLLPQLLPSGTSR